MNIQVDVVAAIIVKESRILAARRRPGKHLAGYWEFPGGKIESGETPEQSLVRELEEEFSIVARIGRYIGESLHDYGTKMVRIMAYEVEHIEGLFRPVDHDELRWLTIEELEQVVWAPADESLVAQYIALNKSQPSDKR